MMHFKDMTFCSHGSGCTCHPSRRLTDEVRAAAARWWGDDGAPIAQGDLCQGKPKEEATT